MKLVMSGSLLQWPKTPNQITRSATMSKFAETKKVHVALDGLPPLLEPLKVASTFVTSHIKDHHPKMSLMPVNWEKQIQIKLFQRVVTSKNISKLILSNESESSPKMIYINKLYGCNLSRKTSSEQPFPYRRKFTNSVLQNRMNIRIFKKHVKQCPSNILPANWSSFHKKIFVGALKWWKISISKISNKKPNSPKK